MNDHNRALPTWDIFFAELIGTALLVLVGLSIVIFMFGAGSSMALLVPHEGLRRAITGVLFGSTGGLIALSHLGRVSGAHINPVVSIGFRLMGKVSSKLMLVYVFAQLIGAGVAAFPLLLWGDMGQSVLFGAAVPGPGYIILTVLLGEVVTTLAMVSLLMLFLAIRKIRHFTPAIFPPLYSFMVWAEAPISGTSTNPARSLGPSLVSGVWQEWWIYWVGPMVGMFLALALLRFLAEEIEVAKLYHFDTHHARLFRKKQRKAMRS
jgi:aquaporin Z